MSVILKIYIKENFIGLDLNSITIHHITDTEFHFYANSKYSNFIQVCKIEL